MKFLAQLVFTVRVRAPLLFSTSLTMSKSGQWFYAVRRGRNPGVYNTWPECQAEVKEFRGPVFKKFPTYDEALNFINAAPGSKRSFQSSSKSEESTEDVKDKKQPKLDDDAKEKEPPKSDDDAKEKKQPKSDDDAKEKKQPKSDDDKDSFTGETFAEDEGSHVYTDGGCFFNGKHGAQAGLGVFWKEGDEDNISEPLPGRPTNNRAEIHAAVRAVQVAKKRGISNLILHTDSQFLINGITKWIKGWKKKGWVLSTGKPVVNREDFEALDDELQDINVKWVHVRGHSGDPSNEAVDRLAKLGAKKSKASAEEK